MQNDLVPRLVVNDAPRITFISMAAFHLKMRMAGAHFSYALDFGKLPIGPVLGVGRKSGVHVIQFCLARQFQVQFLIYRVANVVRRSCAIPSTRYDAVEERREYP